MKDMQDRELELGNTVKVGGLPHLLFEIHSIEPKFIRVVMKENPYFTFKCTQYNLTRYELEDRL